MTILRNSAKASQRSTKNLNVFLLTYALLGLLALAGLIFHEGAAPVRAEVTTADAPAQPADPLLPALQPPAQITTPTTLSPLDVVVVFDISGSMEDQTICHDCWKRTSYDPNWPNNGYFNPIPYNKVWKDTAPGGPGATGNQSIPDSALCTTYPPQPFITGTLQYLVVEAELYSRNVGDWHLDARAPGNGFWAIQRGTRSSTSNGLSETSDQYNRAGDEINQSSNVCRPNVQGNQIDCTVGNGNGGSGDNVCADDAGLPNSTFTSDIRLDCSSFIAARPFSNYNQTPGNVPRLVGAAYNADCFSGSGFSGACWSNNPFNPNPGLEQGPSNVPYVEYDFTPTWSGNTYIWIRAMGGGNQSYTWASSSPDQIQPDRNGGGFANNITPWVKTIYWQVDNGNITQRKDNLNNDYSNSPTENYTQNSSYHFQMHTSWLANRAEAGSWRWILLGNTTTFSGTQSTFKMYQGSAGYMVDKIVFTNDTRGNTPERGAEITTMTGNTIPEVLRRRVDGTIQTSGFNSTDQNVQNNAWRDAIGPPASAGSATREACNLCNPAYGYTVDPSQCSCKRTANESGYGSGAGCTLVLTTTNQLQAELQTGLYSGLQPIRSAQESVKHLARRLDPKFDQLGLVAFSTDSPGGTRRAKLQCLVWAAAQMGNPAYCYEPALGTPLSYTHVISAVEQQWPGGGTNIALGMREGLEELGVSTPGNPAASNCTPTINDGNACDREGPVRKVLILMTDGSPNNNPGNCAPSSGWPDLWDGLIGPADDDFECAAYYAYLAAQNSVSVYTIGIGAGPDPDLLTAMATGIDLRGESEDTVMFNAQCGQYFAVSTPADMDNALAVVLAHARNCVPNAPSLALTQSDSPDPVQPAELLTYTLTVTNTGAVSATGTIITDTLDNNVSFVSASDGGLYNSGIVIWNVGTILPSQTITRSLVVTVGNMAGGAILTNTAWVRSDTGISDSSTAKTTIANSGPNGELIWAGNYTVTQSSSLLVHLGNHFQPIGPYDIYLDDGNNLFKICDGVNTTPTTNNGDFNCSIPGAIPPGFYSLFSTLTGSLTPLAVAPAQVQVIVQADICTNPLAESGFETMPTVRWLGIGSNGTFPTTSSYAGNQALLADTNRSGANNPAFSQRFTVPASLTGSGSSIRLRLFKNIEAEVDGSDPNDLFYAVIATGPGLTSTLVTQPALIATGEGPIAYNPANWQELNLIFHAASGVNLADYAGQDLYLYFYNNSNQTSGCPPSNCHNTSFYFDDISLTFCTPAAPPQATAPPEIQPGGAFNYTITVANTGSANANGVVLSNRLDDQLNFVSASDGGQHNAGLVTWNIGTLPLSQTITRSVAVTAGNVVSGTLLSSTVMLTSTEGLSYTTVVTTRVSGTAAPGSSSTYLPIIVKQK